MKKIFLILTSLVFLNACVPKYAYVKNNFAGTKPTIENIMIVVEFVSLKDDVGKLWDFDEDYNLKYQDDIYQGTKKALIAKGYKVLPTYLKTSGLLIEQNYQAEHYKNKKLQEQLINPPFIVRSVDLDNTEIDALVDIHYELYSTVSPIIASETNNYRHNKVASQKILANLNLPKNTAILIISANKPRVSAVKNIGIGLLTVGIVAGATSGAYIGVSTLHGISSTKGFLVDQNSGELLWANYASMVNINPRVTSFFNELPPAANFKTNNIETVQDLPSLYDASTIALFKARPTVSTLYGLDEKLAGGKFNHRLEDFSPTAEAQLRQTLRGLNQQLQAAKNQDENNAVMQNLIRYFAGNQDFSIGYIDTWMGLSAFVVNQINGPLLDIPSAMINNQQIKNLADANDYLNRLDHYDLFVENVLAKMEADTSQGWIPPLVIIHKSIAAMQSFSQPQANKHPLVTSFANKLAKLDNISAIQKTKLHNRAKKIVTTKVYPAYKMVITKLNDLTFSASKEAGIWAQPNGAAFYQDAVKMLGDSDLTPAQIHQLGLDEVTRISQEMDVILRSQDMTKGTVGQRMLTINNNAKFLYADSDTGRKQLLADLNGHIKEISGMMDEQFASRPKYQVEVRKFPKDSEQTAPGGMYTPPPLDGSTPGIYWINLRDIKANPKFDLKTLTYHEAIPGHHWQIALNMEQESLPMLRRIAPYNAYTEGWALYSEKVAAEMGMYKNDPFSDLGRLKAEMFRAVRLVVDTGLHYKKWSREHAIKYMAETTGTVESDVVIEIERYMIWPGQALGYKLGMINILKLRADAKKQLGDKFDIKEFHDLVLLGGAVPMEILNNKVANWIIANK